MLTTFASKYTDGQGFTKNKRCDLPNFSSIHGVAYLAFRWERKELDFLLNAGRVNLTEQDIRFFNEFHAKNGFLNKNELDCVKESYARYFSSLYTVNEFLEKCLLPAIERRLRSCLYDRGSLFDKEHVKNIAKENSIKLIATRAKGKHCESIASKNAITVFYSCFSICQNCGSKMWIAVDECSTCGHSAIDIEYDYD